jgi:hypothetical protein
LPAYEELTIKIVKDIDKDDPYKAVYGSGRSYGRAWVKIPSPNPEIVLNG